MQAAIEYWVTGYEKFSSEYWLILKNAFQHGGLGVVPSRALVVGSSRESKDPGRRIHQYVFLWILPKSKYLLESRQASCCMFKLVKTEQIYCSLDVEEMRTSMLQAHKDHENTEFVKEFWISGDCGTKLSTKAWFESGSEKGGLVQQAVEEEAEQAKDVGDAPVKELFSEEDTLVVPDSKVECDGGSEASGSDSPGGSGESDGSDDESIA